MILKACAMMPLLPGLTPPTQPATTYRFERALALRKQKAARLVRARRLYLRCGGAWLRRMRRQRSFTYGSPPARGGIALPTNPAKITTVRM